MLLFLKKSLSYHKKLWQNQVIILKSRPFPKQGGGHFSDLRCPSIRQARYKTGGLGTIQMVLVQSK